ncbi:MAG: hypothetical protein ACRDYZ_13200 [Acidimicrobiales bacterium]
MTGAGAATGTGPAPPLAERVRSAIVGRDIDAFAALLAEDVRWGDDDAPNRCRSRTDVTATLARGVLGGGTADLLEVATGTRGILCALRVSWPGREAPAVLYHVYLVGDDRIHEIQRYDDRRSAAEAGGLAT